MQFVGFTSVIPGVFTWSHACIAKVIYSSSLYCLRFVVPLASLRGLRTISNYFCSTYTVFTPQDGKVSDGAKKLVADLKKTHNVKDGGYTSQLSQVQRGLLNRREGDRLDINHALLCVSRRQLLSFGMWWRREYTIANSQLFSQVQTSEVTRAW